MLLTTSNYSCLQKTTRIDLNKCKKENCKHFFTFYNSESFQCGIYVGDTKSFIRYRQDKDVFKSISQGPRYYKVFTLAIVEAIGSGVSDSQGLTCLTQREL